MKLLLDENLSPRLAQALDDLFPGSVHTQGAGLGAVDDAVVWAYAKAHGFAIVSKDSDFMERSVLEGYPPKVICVRLGNCSTLEVENLLRSSFGPFRLLLSWVRRLVCCWGEKSGRGFGHEDSQRHDKRQFSRSAALHSGLRQSGARSCAMKPAHERGSPFSAPPDRVGHPAMGGPPALRWATQR